MQNINVLNIISTKIERLNASVIQEIIIAKPYLCCSVHRFDTKLNYFSNTFFKKKKYHANTLLIVDLQEDTLMVFANEMIFMVFFVTQRNATINKKNTKQMLFKSISWRRFYTK